MSEVLRAPTYLGVHTLVVGDEALSLDGGGLLVWVGGGAAHDASADPQVMPPLAGEKVGGAFLCAEARGSSAPLHCWLDVPGQHSLPEPARARLGAAARVFRPGAYRLTVLRVELIETESGEGAGGEQLQPSQLLTATFAVDRTRSRKHSREEPLPPPGAPPFHFWLSTAAVQQLSFGGAERVAAAEAERPALGTSSLPRIAPLPFGNGVSEPDSLELQLHCEPLEAVGGARRDSGFGWPTLLWRASLDLIRLGEGEEHRQLPLRAGGAPQTLSIGGLELDVLQVVTMFASEADGGQADGGGLLSSDYPLLLLHVQLALRTPEEPSAPESPLDDARRLGLGLEKLLGLDDDDDDDTVGEGEGFDACAGPSDDARPC